MGFLVLIWILEERRHSWSSLQFQVMPFELFRTNRFECSLTDKYFKCTKRLIKNIFFSVLSDSQKNCFDFRDSCNERSIILTVFGWGLESMKNLTLSTANCPVQLCGGYTQMICHNDVSKNNSDKNKCLIKVWSSFLIIKFSSYLAKYALCGSITIASGDDSVQTTDERDSFITGVFFSHCLKTPDAFCQTDPFFKENR